jgi:hypothetical protein
MATTIKLKNGSGAPLAGDLVAAEPAFDLTNKRLYTEDSGGTVIEVGTNPGTDVTFADNRKAIFGAGSDLEIYHNGSNSIIKDNGTGNLLIQGATDIVLEDTSGANYFRGVSGSYVRLYHNNSTKLETTATGIDVTGDVNSDSVTTGTFTSTGIDDNATSTAITIDSSENVGIGTTSPNYQLTVGDGTDALETINIISTDASQSRIFFSDASNNGQGRFTYDHSDDSLQVFTNDTERMRIDSSGRVGIGSSDPSSGTSTYYDDLVIRNDTSGTGAGITIQSNTTNGFGAVEFRKADGTQVGKMYASSADGQLAFETGGSERMRIDSSGNVGIGTTSPNASLHISQNPAVLALGSTGSSDPRFDFYDQGTTTIGASIFLDQSEDILCLLRTASGSATDGIRIDSSGNVGIGSTNTGGFKLDVAGTARANNLVFRADTSTPSGDAAIFRPATSSLALSTNSTERMRIDSSGNVGIGTTSPATYSNAPELVIDTGTSGGITVKSGTAGYGAVFFADGTTGNEQYRGSIQYNHDFSGVTDALLFGTAGAERMRIDSSGNVIAGGTSAQAADAVTLMADGEVTAAGFYFSNNIGSAMNDTGIRRATTSTMVFDTGSTERMRINSSGNLLVGTLTNRGRITSEAASGFCFDGYITTSTAGQDIFVIRSDVGGTANANLVIEANGDVLNTNNSYGSISDERLKSNIVDASPQIDDIMAVQVRSYTLNATGDTHIGVVAQELEASGMSGLVKENEEGIKAVKYSVLYMKAIKALQEAVTRIETLEAEVAALKGA